VRWHTHRAGFAGAQTLPGCGRNVGRRNGPPGGPVEGRMPMQRLLFTRPRSWAMRLPLLAALLSLATLGLLGVALASLA